MKTNVPTITQDMHTELITMLVAMQTDYDNGLREFQEAIHYAIFHMNVCDCKNVIKKDAVNHILYLRDLADRLHVMENVINMTQ